MFFILCYRYLLFPVAYILGFFLKYKNKKLAQGFAMRKSFNGTPPWLSKKLDEPIWIHCSSGEFEYAKSLIREIKNKKPQQQILVTYFSPSTKNSIESYDLVDFSCPSPWDSPRTMGQFIQAQQPKCLLVARTDIWPEMLYQCSVHKVPSYLFSATLVEKSARLNTALARNFYSFVHSLFEKIYCVSEADKVEFAKYGLADKCEILGDTRYDQVIYRLQQKRQLPIQFPDTFSQPVMICGSTWKEDEEQLFSVISKMKDRISFLLVPHEPDKKHIKQLQTKAQELGLKYQLYSQSKTWETNKVLIVDVIGVLADLYAFADIAFIGGSFKSSVHSVMEALAAGCQTYVGPYHLNNREAILFQNYNSLGLNYVVSVANSTEMLTKIEAYLAGDQKQLKIKILEKIQELSGATQLLLEKVPQLLYKS